MNKAPVEDSNSGASERLVERLRTLVELESPSGGSAGLRAVTDEVTRSLVEIGGEAVLHPHPTGDHAVISFAGTAGREAQSPLLLLIHADTVWPVGALASMPWSDDGRTIRGPGVYDMKGGIVVLEEALRRAITGAHRPLVVIVTADEEVGSPTARSLIEAHAGSARAVLGFEPPHPDGALKTARWGSTRLRVAVTGREAHAALDSAAGVSAIDELVDQLVYIRRVLNGVDGVLANVGTISGGSRTNVVAGAASAEIGLRFRDQTVESDILAELTARQPFRRGAEVTVEILSNRPAWQRAAPHDQLIAEISDAAREVGQEIEGRATTGAADTNFTGRLGVASVDGLGPLGRGAHAVDEQIIAGSLMPRVELVAALLSRL